MPACATPQNSPNSMYRIGVGNDTCTWLKSITTTATSLPDDDNIQKLDYAMGIFLKHYPCIKLSKPIKMSHTAHSLCDVYFQTSDMNSGKI